MILEGYAVTYGVVDAYETIFDRGVFADIELPVPLLYGHQYTRIPVGIVREAREDDTGLWIRAELADSNRALADYIRLTGKIDDSVGFDPYGFEIDNEDRIHFTKSDLLEVSVTPWGAVPGAELAVVDGRQEPDLAMEQIRSLFDEMKTALRG